MGRQINRNSGRSGKGTQAEEEVCPILYSSIGGATFSLHGEARRLKDRINGHQGLKDWCNGILGDLRVVVKILPKSSPDLMGRSKEVTRETEGNKLKCWIEIFDHGAEANWDTFLHEMGHVMQMMTHSPLDEVEADNAFPRV
ncbi:hypothetical protein [Delftia phage PhiW-14]|uniref:Uncharacterized protein n=1 Tax=Delftia phage PhiW-14 TaxID=665032 RepID=C9DGH9_BPW14|nr:hypothetical protein DP-phiW-14_gp209 [Delftia phage PhiW-14]ACV50230.1 hypothetical protein [Delftia phage PhiW-14]